MLTMPIPVPEGTPPWVGALLVVAAMATFAVLAWQTVRYFRNNRDDE